jgi:hypothetical protein
MYININYIVGTRDGRTLILIGNINIHIIFNKPVNTHHHGNYGISKVITYILAV